MTIKVTSRVISTEQGEATIFTFPIAPLAKPRMTTKQVRWLANADLNSLEKSVKGKGKAIQQYLRWKSAVQLLGGKLYKHQAFANLNYLQSLNFFVPMAKSWSKKKKAEHAGRLMIQQRPDLDNYWKAFLDALISEDHIVGGASETGKYWAYEGKIELGLYHQPYLPTKPMA